MKTVRKSSSAIVIAVSTVGVLIGVIVASAAVRSNRHIQTSQPPALRSALSKSAFSNRTADCKIALPNLQCGALTGTSELEVQRCLTTLDEWADRVRSETQRHLYKFRAKPSEFESSEGYFRMLMVAVVLYEDFGIRYNPKLMAEPAARVADYSFFADPRDVFISGLLGPERMGTCSSMPVLYIAIGRRLGYPLKLVTTKAHLFIRWEGNGERFNLEATGKGMNRYDDEHYKQWPFPVTDEEIKSDGYLKSLTPDEELAVFLSIRGHCLMAARRYSEAEKCYAQAAHLAPESRGYRLLQQNASHMIQLAGKETQ